MKGLIGIVQLILLLAASEREIRQAKQQKSELLPPPPKQTYLQRIRATRNLSCACSRFPSNCDYCDLVRYRIGIWGPFWPTDPVFLATAGASPSAPLDVPFVIENKSGVFALEGIQLTCKALMVSSVDPNGKPLVGIWNSTFERRIAGATNHIAPTKSAPYSVRCRGFFQAMPM